MQHHVDDYSLNSISYSMIQTEPDDVENSEDTCTCGRDDFAVGDGYFQQRYPTKKLVEPYSKLESTNNYRTVTEHELLKPYPKITADRFEAEYAYTVRWAAGHKFVAVKVIPFQSNFYSAVRLTFEGRNWALKSGNFKDQYDYCGWLPTPTASQKQLQGDEHLFQKLTSLMTDSSQLSPNQQRQTAGKTTGPSDTGYEVKSLATDYSDDSVLTKDPIDPDIYQIAGMTNLEDSLHSTLENLSPIPHANKSSTYLHNHYERNTEESVSLTSIGSNGSDLRAVFHDLVELNELLAQQAEEAKSQCLEEYINGIGTAVSFSENDLTTAFGTSPSELTDVSPVTAITSDSVVHPPQTMLGQLACFAGRKMSMGFLKNWIKK